MADEQAALEEIELTYRGEYGKLDASASPVITEGGRPVAAVLTVKEAPWSDTPSGPFFIEVMVHPNHRRKGLARHAVLRAAESLLRRGERTVALRVMSDNDGALALYDGLGFSPWPH